MPKVKDIKQVAKVEARYKVDKISMIECYASLLKKLEKMKDEDKKLQKHLPTPPTIKEYEESLTAILDDNKNNTACRTCPHDGDCPRLNWSKDHSFIKVTGCSLHPDQESYPGHSTTVVITDSTVSAYSQENNGNFVTAVNAAAASAGVNTAFISSYTYETVGTRVIGRGHLYFDTSAILDIATIVSAKHIFYCYNKFATGIGGDNLYIYKGVTAPHSPIVVGDYDRTKYGALVATKARNSNNLNAYNDWDITDLSYIVKAGITKGYIRFCDDVTVTDPVGNSGVVMGIGLQGSTGANPPRLSITYNSPIFDFDEKTNWDWYSGTKSGVGWKIDNPLLPDNKLGMLPTWFDDWLGAGRKPGWIEENDPTRPSNAVDFIGEVQFQSNDNAYCLIHRVPGIDNITLYGKLQFSATSSSNSWMPSIAMYWDVDNWVRVGIANNAGYTHGWTTNDASTPTSGFSGAALLSWTWYYFKIKLTATNYYIYYSTDNGVTYNTLFTSGVRPAGWVGAPNIQIGQGYMDNPAYPNSNFANSFVAVGANSDHLGGDVVILPLTTSGTYLTTKTIPSGKKLNRLYIGLTGGDANNYIDKVEVIAGLITSTCNTNISTSTLLTSLDFDGGFDPTTGGTISIKLYFTGDSENIGFYLDELAGEYTDATEPHAGASSAAAAVGLGSLGPKQSLNAEEVAKLDAEYKGFIESQNRPILVPWGYIEGFVVQYDVPPEERLKKKKKEKWRKAKYVDVRNK